MRDLPSILLVFRNEFNKFNNTGAHIVDIYHMTLKLIKIAFLTLKRQDFAIFNAMLFVQWTSLRYLRNEFT